MGKKCLLMTLLASVCFLSMNSLVFAGPVILKAVSFLPKTQPVTITAKKWVSEVNEAFKGEIEVKYLGGPEIIGSKEQIQALKNGIIDINFNVASYYAPHAPEINAFQLSKYSPWEEREPGGFYDYMSVRHQKLGITYLGRWLEGSFYVWVNKSVKTPDELTGLKLRVGPMYIYFMKKLGVSTVSIKPTDVYTALERGTVDGFAWPILGARSSGWTDKCKYIIDHPFYRMDGTILIGEKSLKKLSEVQRKKLMDFTINYEKDMVKVARKAIDDERGMLQKNNVKFIKFSESDAHEYLRKADEAYWEFLASKVPNLIPELKKITGN